MAASAPQLSVRLPEKALKAEESGSLPPTPPAAASGAAHQQLLSAQSSTELLPCGLFEDELHELDELKQSHSPKNASLTEAAQLK